MAEIGYALSSEEHGPRDLVEYARRGEAAGFRSVFISDHYHPWLESQGESPFVWSVIGAIAATTELRIVTGVTCPTIRIHPAILAQAAATSSLLAGGRFAMGVGSGEALNEHILGDRWPPADVRLEMLEEAVEVMRTLWEGKEVTYRGRYYTVENARVYSCPPEPPPVLVSGFGAKSTALAARIGEGFISTAPDSGPVTKYRQLGGQGPAVAGMKVCWAEDEASAVKLAHDRWRSTGVPGELSQELPVPAHFEQASQHVTPEMVAAKISCGPDPERHAASIQRYLDAGYDEVYVTQIGEDQAGFLEAFTEQIRPLLAA